MFGGLGPSSFTPHGFCLALDPAILWLDVVSDSLTALAYFSIPAMLAFILYRRKGTSYGWLFWMTAGFILASGIAHALAVVTLWTPLYWLQGATKAVTALASFCTAIAAAPLVPKVIAMPTHKQLRINNGRLTSLVEALRRERAELDKAYKALAQAQRMKTVGALTGGVAHEFNNTLQVIGGSLSLLEKKVAPEHQKYVGMALSGVGRGALLVRQLLAFARRQILDPRPTDIAALVSNTGSLLNSVLGARITVTVEADDDAPWAATVDAAQLETAIINIGLNARDAIPHAGTFALHTRNVHLQSHPDQNGEAIPDGDYVRISMTDDGCGMDDETIAAATDPFFTTKGPAASGLGLSQAHGFVRQSGGLVTIHSAPGFGTTVCIYLPRCTDEASQGTEDCSSETAGAALDVADARKAD